MRLVRNIALSVMSWVVSTLVAAAAIEIIFGAPRPGFVSMASLIILAPVLFVIWRPQHRGRRDLPEEESISTNQSDLGALRAILWLFGLLTLCVGWGWLPGSRGRRNTSSLV